MRTDAVPPQSDDSELFGSPRNPLSREVPVAGAGPSTSGWGHSLIDTRAYGRLKSFSGKEEEWSTWSFVARSYLDLLSMGYRELLTAAEAIDQASEIRTADMSATARTHSWTLFNVLTQSIEGGALSIIMNAEPSNGLQAWMLLVDNYEPKIGGRYTAMLMGIIGPQWGHIKEADFMESVDTWEVQIRRYEDQSREKVTAATKVAVIMKHAPGGIRAALRTSSSIIGSDYERLKKAIRDYLQTGADYDPKGLTTEAKSSKDPSGPEPMDVGALSKGGKKGKGDGQWQKGKGKKGKYEKGKTKTKGKFEGKGSKKFEGYCSYCNKWGHKKADCRIREKDRKGSGKGGTAGAIDKTDSPKNEATSGSVQYVNLVKVRNKHEEKPIDHDEDDEADDYYSSGYGEPGPSYTSWSVREVPKRTRWADEQEIADQRGWVGAASFVGSVEGYVHDQYIMYDSGSDEHVCRKDFGGTGDEVQSLVQLNAVSGDALKILGERKVILELEGMKGPIPIEVVFQVGKNCQKNILSSGKMFRKGFKSITDPDGASYLYHNKFKDKIPLFMYGNSFYLKIHNVKSMPRDAKVQKAIAAPVLGEADDWENAGQSEEDVEEIPQREVDDRHIESRMSLTPSSTIAQMRERLKALGYAIHGSKAEVWSRLKRAEKEEYKRREKEAAREAEAAGRNADVMRPGQEVRAPVGPTEAERAKHELTHLPTQTWCQHCMKGKGKEDPHRRVESGREVLQIDYSYLKSDGSYVDGNQEAAEVVLTAADRGTGMFWAMGIPTKNFEKEYVVKSICGFISQLGHMQLSIRTDGEPTILQVANEIRDEMNKKRSKGEEVKVRTEQAPRYSPQSMGAVGAAQSILKGDAMTLKSALEGKVGLQISPAMNVWLWLVRHSAWSRARFGVKANLRTAYEDAFGSQYTGQILPFGEAVMFKVPHSSSGRKVGGRLLPSLGERHFPGQDE